MLTITAGAIHWLHPPTSEMELCAHATVAVTDAQKELVAPSRAWTVSMAALHLLRTIERDHTTEAPLATLLIPCCGHALFTDDKTGAIVNIGCDNGLEWWVRHTGRRVDVHFSEHSQWSGSQQEWCAAVVHFADAVEAFYAAAEPKHFSSSHDTFVYEKFWEEWRRLRAAAQCAT